MAAKPTLKKMAAASKVAARTMATASTATKNAALKAMITALAKRKNDIFVANNNDIAEARDAGLDAAMIDRLSLQGGRLDGILQDIETVIKLPDPVGECYEKQKIDSLEIEKCRTPLGVLGVIYESRPNVTIDVSALTIKSGNCAILRGGSETLRTNLALASAIQEALISADLPAAAIQLVATPDRSQVKKMLRLHDSIDLIIPRGGAALHRFCRENSTIPVITGGIGICHLFVDSTAELDKSLPVIVNAKTQRPTVCNALDTLLVHESIADSFIPKVLDLLSKHGVTFKLDPTSMQIAKKAGQTKGCTPALPEDWETEWLSLVLGIKVVKNLSEALEHIYRYSTGHSDGILTTDKKNAEQFIRATDSAAVYVNASTRFTDGGQLGLGAEVAISTQKLHARGPMGLRELTTYKWVIHGDYSVRK